MTDNQNDARMPSERKNANSGKTTTAVGTATIAAPADVVWGVVSDARRNVEWVDVAIRVPQADTPARVGATYTELSRIAGPLKVTTHWRIAEFEAPRRQVHEGTGVPTNRDMKVILELSPEGETTKFVNILQYTPRFGLLGAVLDRVVRASIARSQQRSVDSLAALIAKEYSNS